jgi:hypothetical protein
MSGKIKCPIGYGEVEFGSFTHPGKPEQVWQDIVCPISGAVRCAECNQFRKEAHMNIGGSLFVYNAQKYDYCMAEAVESLLAFCDEVVVLDCGSTDGTLEILKAMAGKYSALKIHEGGNWEIAPGRERLSMLANQAKSYLNTDWHFMLQADEVVHEASIPFIKEAVASGNAPGYHCRRWNCYGSPDLCIRLDSNAKPCGDRPVRLARIDIPAVDDAEGLAPSQCSPAYEEKIQIVHYGLVRKGAALIEKAIDMQKWFFGNPDYRLIEAQKEGVFVADVFTPESEYMPLPCSHPVYTRQWLAERANDPTRRVKR